MKKQKVAKAENHERWLITYADLITLLLVFFVVLYAGSQEDSKKFAILAQGLRSAFNNVATADGAGGSSAVFTGSGAANAGGGQQEMADFQSIAEAVRAAAAARGVLDKIDLRMEPDRIVVGLTGDLLFASGSAQVRPAAGPVLDAIARSLQNNPNEIRVEGHTDNVPLSTPDFNSNWELSSARATAVLRRLIDAGLPPNRAFAAAFADTRPRADNSTPEGRAANRRAEIVILYPAGGAQPQASPTPSRR
jgi:chemotaxis protein MotB